MLYKRRSATAWWAISSPCKMWAAARSPTSSKSKAKLQVPCFDLKWASVLLKPVPLQIKREVRAYRLTLGSVRTKYTCRPGWLQNCQRKSNDQPMGVTGWVVRSSPLGAGPALTAVASSAGAERNGVHLLRFLNKFILMPGCLGLRTQQGFEKGR